MDIWDGMLLTVHDMAIPIYMPAIGAAVSESLGSIV